MFTSRKQHILFHPGTGAYLGEIASMASAEIAPLSKHDTQHFYYYYLREEDYDNINILL